MSTISKDSWALKKTGFERARTILDDRGAPYHDRPVAVIDSGTGALDHWLFENTLTRVPPKDLSKGEADGSHAAEVAGVIAIACPEAKLLVYNIATTAGPDRNLFLAALRDVPTRRPKPCVVNISLGWLDPDPDVDLAITNCVALGVPVVAAMGEFEEPSDFESYPAACDGVIAVGATDRFDLRVPGSSVGEHIWVAAPGDDIDTVVTNTDIGVKSGTSFAAALVSAAVYFAVRANPGASPDTIRDLLGRSADNERVTAGAPKAPRTGSPEGTWNPAVGCGRLDVAKLVTLKPRPVVAEKPVHATR
jgi:Subtilase family